MDDREIGNEATGSTLTEFYKTDTQLDKSEENNALFKKLQYQHQYQYHQYP